VLIADLGGAQIRFEGRYCAMVACACGSAIVGVSHDSMPMETQAKLAF
jgi:hypothetical protein